MQSLIKFIDEAKLNQYAADSGPLGPRACCVTGLVLC